LEEFLVNARISSAIRAMLALLCVTAASPVRAEDPPPRVVVVLKSSDALLADLEHVIAGQAGKKKEWENNVLPNIEIFLFGVDRAQPVRYDQIMGGEGGRREQAIVPVPPKDLKLFISDNLDPIDIIAKKDKKHP